MKSSRSATTFSEIAIGILLLLFLASCSIYSREMPTITFTPHVTFTTTGISTVTPSATASRIPLTRPIPQVTVTSTPDSMFIPTLSQTEKDKEVLDLLTSNGGCHLPCWWGITPGQTTWQQAWNLLSRFDSKLYTAGKPLEHGRFMEANISIPVQSGVGEIRTTVTASQDIVETIDVGGTPISSGYQVADLLSKYGPPDEIWISTYQSYPADKVPFVLVLFYRNGFLAGYSTLVKPAQEAVVQGCFAEAPQLRLWNPTEQNTFQEVAALFNWDVTDGAYLPLEKASDLSVETFYRNYQSPTRVPCVKTQVKLWPK